MAETCPICFNDIGTFTDDPLKMPNHFDATLKGNVLFRARHITELQDMVNEYEGNVGIAYSKWSPCNDKTDLPNIRHVNELREAIEAVLTKIGTSLSDYLSMDADGKPTTPATTDWLDGHRLTRGTLLRGMHIEQLRKKFDTTIPMWLFNGGGEATTIPNADTAVDILYNQRGTIYYYIQFMWTPWAIQVQGVNGCPDDTGFPYMNYTMPTYHFYTEGGITYTVERYEMQWVYEWIWYPLPLPGQWVYTATHQELKPVLGDPVINWIVSNGLTYWRAYKRHYTYSGWKANITAIPRENNLVLPRYGMKEIVCSPLLVDETLGYPCRQYVGDIEWYAQPKEKSCGWLEDAVGTAGADIVLTPYTYTTTAAFKMEHNASITSYGTINEDAFDERQMDRLSWGMSFPPASLMPPNYMRSVSRWGGNQCGNYSIFVPSLWNLQELDRYVETLETNWTFQRNPGSGQYDDLDWNIDLRLEHIENDIYDPTEVRSRFMIFRGNALLTKEDGVTLALDKKRIQRTIYPADGGIDAPDYAIARTIDMWVDGDLWEQVENFDNSISTSKHYMVDIPVANQKVCNIVFGDGTKGYRVTQASDVEIEAFVKEVFVSKYYPDGHIVISNTQPHVSPTTKIGLREKSVYMLLKFYQIPSFYWERSDAITKYWCSYWDKPATRDVTLSPSGTYPPSYWPPALSGMTAGRSLRIVWNADSPVYLGY
ncbi:MAG: hypothetical protein WC208_10500 [Gallionella sp.]|jgi:hypothetical protein